MVVILQAPHKATSRIASVGSYSFNAGTHACMVDTFLFDSMISMDCYYKDQLTQGSHCRRINRSSRSQSTSVYCWPFQQAVT